MTFKRPDRYAPATAEDVRLTPVEAKVHGLILNEHRAQKCGRCKRRHDLADGGYVCLGGMDPGKELAKDRGRCEKFLLDEDQGRWLG